MNVLLATAVSAARTCTCRHVLHVSLRQFGNRGARPQRPAYYKWWCHYPPFITRIRYRFPKLGMRLTIAAGLFVLFTATWRDLYEFYVETGGRTSEDWDQFMTVKRQAMSERARFGVGFVLFPWSFSEDDKINLNSPEQTEVIRKRYQLGRLRQEREMEENFIANKESILRNFRDKD